VVGLCHEVESRAGEEFRYGRSWLAAQTWRRRQRRPRGSSMCGSPLHLCPGRTTRHPTNARGCEGFEPFQREGGETTYALSSEGSGSR
jgi:hypothetical protein